MNLDETIVLEIENCTGDTKMCIAIDFYEKTITTKNCSLADITDDNLYMVNYIPAKHNTIRLQQDNEDLCEFDDEFCYEIGHLFEIK